MEIQHFQTLPSTSQYAAAAAREGAGHLYTVVAESQSAGRGRMERSFFSPPGGLYFSTVLRTPLTPAEYGAVTPFAALAVRRALYKICGVTAQIKWVNDLLVEGRKVCGILAESGVDSAGRPYIILGIGINTGNTAFPPALCESAGSVPCCEREMLLQEILAQLNSVTREIREGHWLSEYRDASAVLGRRVRVFSGSESYLAIPLDILPSGALLVRDENGKTHTLCGGEISLRLTQDAEK